MDKILIIADINEKCFATPRGLELAARLGLGVDVVAFTHAPLGRLKVSEAEESVLRERLLEEREKIVRARIDRHSAPAQKVNLRVVWEKHIFPWVNDRCAEESYMAVVKTGNRSESIVHEPNDWQLLRECPAPVLIVAEKKWYRTKPVLACLDLSTTAAQKRALNHKVLAAAKWLAEGLGVGLEIISVVDLPRLLSDLDLVDPHTYFKEARESMQPHVRELAEAHQLQESAFVCKRGPVEKVITSRAAEVRAQIVVLGTVGRKGVRARLIGNTAEQVLCHMKTDVLAIKP
jgi:universal stress protein E